jgi:son of sevenless
MHATTSDFPPPSILPRRQGKFKLLDIDPLELARQLTIMESELFFKIKQSECIARSKESTPSGPDNIKSVITVTNKVRRFKPRSILLSNVTLYRWLIGLRMLSLTRKTQGEEPP